MGRGGTEPLAVLYRLMGSKQRPLRPGMYGLRAQPGKTCSLGCEAALAARHIKPSTIRVFQPDPSTARSSYVVQTYREGSKKASMLEKTILDRTRLLKHGTLSPESLHAESQWDRPQRGQPRGSRVRAV